MRRERCAPMLALSAAALACAPAREPAPLREPAPARASVATRVRDSLALLAPARLAALPAEQRTAWLEYLARSAELRARDSTAMAEELRAAGLARATDATHGPGFAIEKWMTPAWFATDSARRVADRVLSWQAPDGGWSKRVEMMGRARRPGERHASEGARGAWISTLDNGATTEQMDFLARADSARADARYQAAWLRALSWLLEAQMPNGCWPQTFPLQGGYHDAATFNDDAAVHAAEVLRDAAGGRPGFVPAAERAAAADGARRAVECMLAAQVVIDGRRTVWGQQHDPLTLAPTSARSYEPASLASQESARVIRFLLREPDPAPPLVAAVHDAADWLRRTAIHGYAYGFDDGLREAPGEGPIWARLYELGTDRPIFSNRDGVVLYDWSQLTDRRHGYAWYSRVPVSTLRAYDRWARAHPRPDDR